MPSIISASTASNTALNFTADTSGVLALQTGSTPTTAVTIDGSQNVGIGTASPTSRLVVQQANNTGDAFRVFANGTDTQLITRYLSSSDVWQISASFASTGAYKPITFFTSDAERMRITSGGAVGIATTSPSYTFQVGDGSADTRGIFLANNNFSIGVGRSTGSLGGYIGSPSSDVMVFSGNGGAEKMRIDSSGNVAIGTNNTSTYRVTIANNGGNQLRLYATDVSTSTTNSIDFWYLDAGGSPYNNTSIRSISAANAGNGSLLFYTRATSGSLSERMRINSVGSREYTTYNSGNIYGGDAMIGWDNVSAFSIDLTTLFPNLVGTGSAVSLLIQGITWNGGSASSQSFLLNGARGNSSWAFSTANTVNTGTGTSVTPSASGNTLTITFGGGGQYGNAKISIIARN